MVEGMSPAGNGVEPVRVGVLGAQGRMGTKVCQVVDAASDMELVAMVDSGEWLFNVADVGAQVVVDFTNPDVVMDNIRWCLDQGISMVVGTSGFDAQRLSTVESWLEDKPDLGVFIAPNFALGAVLAMQFARTAARHFESVEIIEQHHPDKMDAPSGTSLHTARLVAAARKDAGRGPVPDATQNTLEGARGTSIDGVPVHSMRIRGLVAHQEVWFGNPGETLTIRHDSYDLASFMPGVLLAIRAVLTRPGLTVGLEHALDL